MKCETCNQNINIDTYRTNAAKTESSIKQFKMPLEDLIVKHHSLYKMLSIFSPLFMFATMMYLSIYIKLWVLLYIPAIIISVLILIAKEKELFGYEKVSDLNNVHYWIMGMATLMFVPWSPFVIILFYIHQTCLTLMRFFRWLQTSPVELANKKTTYDHPIRDEDDFDDEEDDEDYEDEDEDEDDEEDYDDENENENEDEDEDYEDEI